MGSVENVKNVEKEQSAQQNNKKNVGVKFQKIRTSRPPSLAIL